MLLLIMKKFLIIFTLFVVGFSTAFVTACAVMNDRSKVISIKLMQRSLGEDAKTLYEVELDGGVTL